MKINKHLAFAALATLALAGCSNNDEVPAGGTSSFPADGVIRVVTNVNNLDTRAGMTSDNFFQFNLKIENEANTSYSYYACMHKNTSYDPWISLVATNPVGPQFLMLWQNSTQPVKVTAFYQVSNLTEEDFNKAYQYNVLQDQSSDRNINNSDHLYMPTITIYPNKTGDADGLTADGELPITFKHLFSKVNLTVTLGTEFNTAPGTATNPISGLTVNGTKLRVNFNASTGVMTDYDHVINNAKPVTPWFDATHYTSGINNSSNAKAKYEVILIPQTVDANNFSVSFKIGGKDYKWTSTGAINLESGYRYALALTAGKDIVTLNSITASEWGAGIGNDLETE